ncbi:Hypothetical predicted protein, partial [Paramuricea clavata]
MTQLKQKHPEPQPAKLGSVLFGPLNNEIPESIYSQINGEMARQAALRTKGSGGPRLVSMLTALEQCWH